MVTFVHFRKKTVKICSISAALLLAIAVVPAYAQSKGDVTLAVGAHQVAPKSDNGSLAGGALQVDVGNSARPTLMLEYFVADNLGIEAIAAWPFSHDISIDGLGKVGSTKHLPPTISLQYHFNGQGKVSPFVGAGVNYTKFFSEKTSGALAGADLSLDASWGLAAHAGIDFKVSERSAIRIDARWIDIDTDVSVDGTKLGSVAIDPLVYGAAWVLKF